MTDPSPLLSQTESKEYQQHASLDDTIEYCIGDFGWRQMLQATLVSLAWFFDAQQAFISVFTDGEPKWTCNYNSSICNNVNLCQLPKDSWSWDFPAETSIISEWSLQCAGSITTGLPASSFFLGCLIGGFALATLADSTLGRKNMLFFSSLLMSLAGVLTAFSTNIWMYVLLRFVGGFGRATVGTCALVLSTEVVGKKWRGKVGIVGFTYFTLGFLSLPIIAYLLQGSSWRLIYLWISVPSVLYSLLVYFLVGESPRWLFLKGRKEEFVETLRSIAAPTNRSNLTESFFSRCTTPEWGEISSQETDIYSAMKILLNKRWAWQRLAAVMVVGFGIGMLYYGMPLGLNNLSLDVYLSMALNALSEFPSALLTFFFIGKLDRKIWVLGLSLLSGICSVTCVLVSMKGMELALELVSYFSACAAFYVLIIYTLELFPTCVRNSAVSMLRQAQTFGAVLSPIVVAVGRSKGGWLSYVVFGTTISVCALFIIWLPETRGTLFSDTMEEEERKVNASDHGVC